MKKNKVVFLNRFFYPDHSATSQILSDLAFYLAKNEMSVSVICSAQSYDNKGTQQSKRETIKGVDVYRIRTTNFGRLWLPGRAIDYLSYFFGMVWILLRIVHKDDVVVAKTDPPLTSVLSLPIAKYKNAAHINWVQDLFPEVAENLGVKVLPAFMVKLLKTLRNWSFKKSQSNVVIGERMKQRLLDQSIPQDTITVIPNWTNNRKVKQIKKEENRFLNEWALDGKFVALYSGNMGRVHEFDTILNAAELLKDNQEIVFLFVGGGPKKGYIEKTVQDKKLKNVVFKPYQDYKDLSFSLSTGDIHLVSLKPEIEGYCVPSKFYGIIAVGKPILFVGDTKGEIARLINADNCGFVIAEGDSLSLAESIQKLANDKSLVQKQSQNSVQAISEKYDIEKPLSSWKKCLSNYFL